MDYMMSMSQTSQNPFQQSYSHQQPIMINLTENCDEDEKFNTTQVDYLRSDKPFVVIHFIQECGRKLEANSITICTAASLFHKFFASASPGHYAGLYILLEGGDQRSPPKIFVWKV